MGKAPRIRIPKRPDHDFSIAKHRKGRKKLVAQSDQAEAPAK